MELLSPQEWEHFISKNPQTHILQTSSWGALKSGFGWSPRFIRQGDTGAMVLFRRLPLGLSVAYIPRGPVGRENWDELWPALDDLCRKEKALFLRVEPDIWEPVNDDFINDQLPGFIQTDQTIQPPRTIMIDLEF